MTSEIAPAGEGREPAAVDRELRASYEDRDKVAEQLRVAAGDGRLTADELDQRLEAALTARTYGELAALTADLPGVAKVEPDVPAVRPQRAEPHRSSQRQREARGPVGGPAAPGRPHRQRHRGAGSHPVTVPHSRVEIDAEVRSGSLKIVTRPGVVVDATDVTLRSGNVKIRSWPGTPPPVSLLIHVTGSVTSGNITARPPRRTFWQWLTPDALAPRRPVSPDGSAGDAAGGPAGRGSPPGPRSARPGRPPRTAGGRP